MRNEGSERTGEERLRADNEYLKLKLMLERGAEFGMIGGDDIIPPEIENRFLRDIIAFESLNDGQAFVQVFEKLGRPTIFPPESAISDEDMDTAWQQLMALLAQHQITVGVCSPNAGPRDLYRFVTEELFYLKISSVNMPGLVHGFIYDEFHPDPYHDNPDSCIEGFMKPLFAESAFQSMHFFRKYDLKLNEHYPLNQRQFMNLVNHFKVMYAKFEHTRFTVPECSIVQDVCTVTGNYAVSGLRKNGNRDELDGAWKIELTQNPGTGVWDINSAEVEGISF